MNDLSDLIVRLEAASEGSRELDRAVYDFLHGEWLARECIRESDGWRHPHYGKISEPQDYTTSLDAALTLVKGLWGVHKEDGPAYARVLPAKADGSFIGQKYFEAEAATPPLALCIAALLAKGTP